MSQLITAVIGVVEYTISQDEAGLVTARYLSTASMHFGEGIVCRGEARGDTANGFPGDYVIRYTGTRGELVGEFAWHIVAVGEGTYRLQWYNRASNALPFADGEQVFEGFGLAIDERRMAVTYWMVPAASTILTATANDRSAAG